MLRDNSKPTRNYIFNDVVFFIRLYLNHIYYFINIILFINMFYHYEYI